MKKRVKITRLPNLKSGAEYKLDHLRAGLGFNANVMPWPIMAGKMSEPDIKVGGTLSPVPRELANLEAEKGEVAMVPGDGGVPDTYNIGGKRHYEGGTPLNLPDDSFIFSDTAKMRIKDPAILAQFSMPLKKGGYTPAEIAKKYKTTPFKKILMDPNADDLQRKTAEQMIANYNFKLAKLAIIQESMKGFPQGIPNIALPYLDQLNIDPSVFVQMQQQEQDEQEIPEEEMQEEQQMSAYGGLIDKLRLRKEGGAFDLYGMYNNDLNEFANGGEGPGDGQLMLTPPSGSQYIFSNASPSETQYRSTTGKPAEEKKSTSKQQTQQKRKVVVKKQQPTIQEPKAPEFKLTPGFGPDEFTQMLGLADEPSIYRQKEIEFSTKSPEHTLAYTNYTSALNSNKPEIMRQIAKDLEQIDVSGLGWIPGSDQDVINNMSAILEEKAAKLEKDTERKSKGPYYKDQINNIESTLNVLYDKMSKMKNTDPGYIKLYNDWKDLNKIKAKAYQGREIYDDYYRRTGKGIDEQDESLFENMFAGFSEGYYNTPAYNPANTLSTHDLKKIASKKLEYSGINEKADSSKTQTTKQDANTTDDYLGNAQIRQVEENNQENVEGATSTSNNVKDETKNRSVKVKQTTTSNDPFDVVIEEESKKLGGPISSYAYGGVIDDEDELVMAQDGIQKGKKLKTYKKNPETGFYYPVYEDDTKGEDEKFEEEASEEDINKLTKMYEEAEASKGTKYEYDKTIAFQKEFHKIFPNFSRSILLGHKDPTTGKPIRTTEARKKKLYAWDLAGNEEGIFGDRTKQYRAYLDKIKKKGAAPAPEKAKEESPKKSDYVDEGLKYKNLDQPIKYTDQSAPEFMQDRLEQLRALNNYFGVKKYSPWSAVPTAQLSDTVFADPTRELAATMEAANIGTQGAAMFAGPQAYNARFAQIQGQQAKNAADIIGRYNNMNIGLANEQAARNAATMNRLSELKAKTATDLYDKYTIADQQFDIAKNNAVNQMFTSKIQAINNAAMAQATSAMSDQFGINPYTGGTIYYKQDRKLNPTSKGEDALLSAFDKLSTRFPKIAQDDPYKLLNIASRMVTGKSVSNDEETDFEKYKKQIQAMAQMNQKNT